MNENNAAAAGDAGTTREIRVAALCINSMGEPEFYWTLVNVTQEDYDNGEHYDACRDAAENEGYDVKRVFDQNDPAAKQLAALAGFFCSTTGEAHPAPLVEAKPAKVVVRISDCDVTDAYADSPIELLVVNFDHERVAVPEHGDGDEFAGTPGSVYLEKVEPLTDLSWFDKLKEIRVGSAKSSG